MSNSLYRPYEHHPLEIDLEPRLNFSRPLWMRDPALGPDSVALYERSHPKTWFVKPEKPNAKS
jgi:hypothetical protein